MGWSLTGFPGALKLDEQEASCLKLKQTTLSLF